MFLDPFYHIIWVQVNNFQEIDYVKSVLSLILGYLAFIEIWLFKRSILFYFTIVVFALVCFHFYHSPLCEPLKVAYSYLSIQKSLLTVLSEPNVISRIQPGSVLCKASTLIPNFSYIPVLAVYKLLNTFLK